MTELGFLDTGRDLHTMYLKTPSKLAIKQFTHFDRGTSMHAELKIMD